MGNLRDAVVGVMSVEPSAPAIEFERTWTSWGALDDAMRSLGALLDQNGGEDLRVGVLLRNRIEFVPAILQIIASGRCLVTLNPVYPDDRIGEDIEKAACPVVIGAPSDFDRPGVMQRLEAQGASCIAAERDGAGVRYRMARSASLELWRNRDAPGIAVEMMTSGTTGKPKRIPLPRRNFERAILDWALFEKGRDAAPKLRSGVTLLTMSFAHIGGVGGLINTITAGRKACLIERFEVETYRDAIVRHRPKVASGPPTILRMLLDADIPREDLESLAAFRSGTAPLDPALAAEFTARYGIPVLQNYGATEFAGGVAGWTNDDHKTFGTAKAGSVGRLNPGIEGRIVDPDTNETRAPGEIGVLELKAAHLGDGQSFVRTTDLAVLDADGFLFIRGRADNAINRGGYKIMPHDVADALAEHAAVKEACVVGIKDPRLGEIPAAAYTLKHGVAAPSEQELRTFLRERLSPYQVPGAFLRLDEFPRTPSLKIDQAGVRALFADREAARA